MGLRVVVASKAGWVVTTGVLLIGGMAACGSIEGRLASICSREPLIFGATNSSFNLASLSFL